MLIAELKSIDAVKIMLEGQTGWLDMNACQKKNPARSAV